MSLETMFTFRSGMDKNMAMAESTGLGRFISKMMEDRSIVEELPIKEVARLDVEAWRRNSPYMTPSTMPVICLINGLGGSGKDSFVHDINSIDSSDSVAVNISPIYPAIEDAVWCLQRELHRYGRLFSDSARENAEPGTKTAEWRTLAHEIKNAWHKVGDGPNKYAIARVIDAIETKSGNNPAPFIFVHTRESWNIEILRESFFGLGLRAIRILVDGRIESSDQPEDKTVRDSAYDVVIDNSGDAHSRLEKACCFTHVVMIWPYIGL